MTLDPVGLALLIPILLLFLLGRVQGLAIATIVVGLFATTAVVILPALGGASVTVPNVAAALLVVAMVPAVLRVSSRRASAAAWLFGGLLLFTAYTLVISAAGPRLFHDGMNVVAMRPLVVRNIYLLQPLAPTTSNITVPAYVLVATLAGLAIMALAADPATARRLQTAFLVTALLHAGFGAADFVGYQLGQPALLDPFRTASYGQLTNEFLGFKRLAGTFSEASAYASFGMPLFVLAVECWWYRAARHAGSIAIASGLLLLMSTSTTAYVAIAVYALFLVLRGLVAGGSGNAHRSLQLAVIAVAMVALLAGVATLAPAVADSVSTMISRVTTGKLDSESAATRSEWARQGFDAFRLSHGLGVGGGSFRSSGLVQAIVGSVGAIGSLCYLLFLASVIRNGWRAPSGPQEFDSRPATVATLFGIVPLVLSGASLDHGTTVSMLAGLALSARYRQWSRRPAVSAAGYNGRSAPSRPR